MKIKLNKGRQCRLCFLNYYFSVNNDEIIQVLFKIILKFYLLKTVHIFILTKTSQQIIKLVTMVQSILLFVQTIILPLKLEINLLLKKNVLLVKEAYHVALLNSMSLRMKSIKMDQIDIICFPENFLSKAHIFF